MNATDCLQNSARITLLQARLALASIRQGRTPHHLAQQSLTFLKPSLEIAPLDTCANQATASGERVSPNSKRTVLESLQKLFRENLDQRRLL